MARATSPLYIGQLTNTPLGDLWLAVSDTGLVAIEWSDSEFDFFAMLTRRYKRPVEVNPKMTALAASQLREYLNGKRRVFDIPIDWGGMRPFQRQVLQYTCAIPYGQTRTYSELAEEMGDKNKARAVGRAQATNPMPLVIPCHRVIGTDHKLRGYGGGDGIPTKEWLLQLEGTVLT